MDPSQDTDRYTDPSGHPEQTGVIVLAGTAAVVVLVVLLVWLRSFFFVMRNETIQANVLSTTNPNLSLLRSHEDSTLTRYEWVDREKGIVRIPIDRAMELLVQEKGNAPAESGAAP